jgi:catechol 2,3-dioxygenase-like lactoylglutathione lyase family enzyme
MADSFTHVDRREFLARVSASTALIAAHVCVGSGEAARSGSPENSPEALPRLQNLELLTAAPLAKMKEFYHDVLGFRILDQQPHRLQIAAGLTRLCFAPAQPAEGQPFYHFAFNIPENKIVAARNWQKERTELLPIPANLRDPAYPDDVVDYRHWNAHSIFFFDPAGNVVEYIARHDLSNTAPGPFQSRDILYASEIGLIVDDVAHAASALKRIVGAGQYRGGDSQFVALGNELGLLLVMKRGRKLSFEAKEKKLAAVFRTGVSVRGTQSTSYAFADYPYKLVVTP